MLGRLAALPKNDTGKHDAPLSLLPFGAALIARHTREGVALTMYGLLLLAIALTRLLVVLVPAALYVVAILISGSLPIASLWIYAGAPILYFAALVFSRAPAPPGRLT